MAVVAEATGKPQQSVSMSDPQFQLKVLWDQWNAVFGKVLGQSERTLVSRLRTARNEWAHLKAFSFEATYRALDDMEQLLTAVASPQAIEVGVARKELLRVQAELRWIARRRQPLPGTRSSPSARWAACGRGGR